MHFKLLMFTGWPLTFCFVDVVIDATTKAGFDEPELQRYVADCLFVYAVGLSK